MGPACTNVRDILSTNKCIVAATVIPADSAPSPASATCIADNLSLTRNHSGCLVLLSELRVGV